MASCWRPGKFVAGWMAMRSRRVACSAMKVVRVRRFAWMMVVEAWMEDLHVDSGGQYINVFCM